MRYGLIPAAVVWVPVAVLWVPVALVFGSSGSGGVAALNHRLMAGIPPGCFATLFVFYSLCLSDGIWLGNLQLVHG